MELVADNQWEVTYVYIPAGDWELKFANTNNFSDKDWGGAEGLSGTAIETTGGKPNLKFTVETAGEYTIRFNDQTLVYSISKGSSNVQAPVVENEYIYPNPAKDLINIHLTENEGEMAMYAMNGQCVMRQHLSEKVSTLSIAQLAKGAYLVKILEQGKSKVCKLIKN